jgi:hypothetical protein
MMMFLVCTHNAQDCRKNMPLPQAASDAFTLAVCLVFPAGDSGAGKGFERIFRPQGNRRPPGFAVRPDMIFHNRMKQNDQRST